MQAWHDHLAEGEGPAAADDEAAAGGSQMKEVDGSGPANEDVEDCTEMSSPPTMTRWVRVARHMVQRVDDAQFSNVQSPQTHFLSAEPEEGEAEEDEASMAELA